MAEQIFEFLRRGVYQNEKAGSARLVSGYEGFDGQRHCGIA
jgi:hypothetical protein